MNTRNAVEVANKLMDMGLAPFVPHLSHFWGTITPRPYEDWLTLDFEFVRRADAVLRLPGESSGADREVALANELQIPVFYSIEELRARLEDE